MPVEVFTREQFEDALPKLKGGVEPAWLHIGIIQGEHSYILPLPNQTAVMVRSSIHGTQSADCGEDSIRCWIVELPQEVLNELKTTKKTNYAFPPAGGKVSKWTTRQKGWQLRLFNAKGKTVKDRGVIGILAFMAMKIRICPTCALARLKVFKVKKEGPNKGKVFLSCKACHHFEFIKDADL